jgi:hypothetical protein
MGKINRPSLVAGAILGVGVTAIATGNSDVVTEPLRIGSEALAKAGEFFGTLGDEFANEGALSLDPQSAGDQLFRIEAGATGLLADVDSSSVADIRTQVMDELAAAIDATDHPQTRALLDAATDPADRATRAAGVAKLLAAKRTVSLDDVFTPLASNASAAQLAIAAVGAQHIGVPTRAALTGALLDTAQTLTR